MSYAQLAGTEGQSWISTCQLIYLFFLRTFDFHMKNGARKPLHFENKKATIKNKYFRYLRETDLVNKCQQLQALKQHVTLCKRVEKMAWPWELVSKGKPDGE